MWKKYEHDAIPREEVLVSDLRSMVNLYQRLKAKVGTEFQEENIEGLIEREERDLLILDDSNDNRYQKKDLRSETSKLARYAYP
ncbi:MAG: hypothetical protein PWQ24_1287 [Mesotoga sp.]|nr:hypothetical protein [Mesotoga sp.]